MLREAIKTIVENGGLVQYPHKKGIKDWFGENKIYWCGSVRPNEPWSVSSPYEGYDNYKTLDEAIDRFCAITFTRKNIALAYEGIRKHKLMDEQYFDDVSESKIRRLVKKYNVEYFDTDYPEFAGK